MSSRPGTMEILMDAVAEEARGLGNDQSLFRVRHELPDKAYPLVILRTVGEHRILIIHQPTLVQERALVTSTVCRLLEEWQ
jgi:hypothetical protein